MKATGIIRRVDELGRVVIPKEIRKTYRINVGDPIEIFTTREGDLVLHKYSPLSDFDEVSSCACDTVFALTEKSCFVCDKDTVLFCAGSLKKEVDKRELSADLRTLLEKGTAAQDTDNQFFRLLNTDNSAFTSYAIFPIFSDTVCCGAIIIIDTQSIQITDHIKTTCSALANMITRQLS